jgi:hypothetical protein
MKFEGLSLLMLNADDTGAANAVTESGAISHMISNVIAHPIYSQGNVNRWLIQHLIFPSNVPGKSSPKILDRTILDSVAAASNRHTHLPLADKKL